MAVIAVATDCPAVAARLAVRASAAERSAPAWVSNASASDPASGAMRAIHVLSVASIASLLSALPVLAAGIVGLAIWWLTAGFLAVYIYRRRTGQFLTVDSGLRMGWITGLLGSTITSVVFTASVVPLIRGGKIAALYEEQFRKMSGNDPNVQEAIKILQSPSGMALFVIMALLFFFLIITFLCTAGGALGAKLAGGVTAPGSKGAP